MKYLCIYRRISNSHLLLKAFAYFYNMRLSISYYFVPTMVGLINWIIDTNIDTVVVNWIYVGSYIIMPPVSIYVTRCQFVCLLLSLKRWKLVSIHSLFFPLHYCFSSFAQSLCCVLINTLNPERVYIITRILSANTVNRIGLYAQM